MANNRYTLTVCEVSSRARSERLRLGGIDPKTATRRTVRGDRTAGTATALTSGTGTNGEGNL